MTDSLHIAKSLIREEEGLRLKPYHCPTGHLSIGYGRNLDDNGISKDEAEYMLDNDMAWVVAQIYRAFPHWSVILNHARYAVVMDMVYNLGMAGFRTFKKLIRAIEDENWDWAALEMKNSKWAGQVGDRENKLIDIMRSGSYEVHRP